MRVLATALTFVLCLALVGAIGLAFVLVVAGPHSDLLPTWLQPWLAGLAWLVVLFLPVWAARSVWRRMGKAAT